jgi:hypothetical protein
MSESITQILDAEQGSAPLIRRRDLLPVWIKVFVWIFLFAGVLVIIGIPAALFSIPFELALYGFRTNDPLTVTGLVLLLVFALKGVVAYGLWWEKDWAVKLAIVDAILGIVLCCFTFIFAIASISSNIVLPFELVLLIPYLLKMRKVKGAWEGS